MASKALLVLCVLLAITLHVSSREVAEKHDEKKVTKDGLENQKYGGYNGGGHGGGGYNGGGHGGGGYPGGGYNGGGHGGGYNGGGHGGGGYNGGGHGRCYHGCCRRGHYGCICCSTADEIPDAQYLAEPHY